MKKKLFEKELPKWQKSRGSHEKFVFEPGAKFARGVTATLRGIVSIHQKLTRGKDGKKKVE